MPGVSSAFDYCDQRDWPLELQPPMSLPSCLSTTIRTISRTSKPFVPYHIRSRQSLTLARFASTLSSEPSSSTPHAVRVRAPSAEDLEKAELDPGIAAEQKDVNFEITPRAAEVRHLQFTYAKTHQNSLHFALEHVF